ncbi:MAG: tetratricopeptide repeat protein [Flavobacteriales bacterium]|nr:tetratricopeptide repeat protein [Flavobacteriales bacterium]
MKSKLVTTLLLSITTICCLSQSALQKNVYDSLWNVWTNNAQHDTARLEAIKKIAWEGYLFSQPDSAFYFAQLEYEFATKRNLKKYQADALNTQGASFFIKTDYAKSIEYHTRSLKIREEINDKKGIAASLGNIGNIFKDQGDATNNLQEKRILYNNAIKYHNKGLKIKQQIKDKMGIAASLSNLGIAYRSQGHIETDTIQKEKFYLQALSHQEKSLEIQQSSSNLRAIANNYSNMGLVYTSLCEIEKNKNKRNEFYKKSIDSYIKSLEILQKIGHQQGIARALVNIGTIYLEKAKTTENASQKRTLLLTVIDYSKQALHIALKRGFSREIEGSTQQLFICYKALKQYNLALQMHELFSATKDSIRSVENQNEVIRQVLKYEYEKKAATDSISNEKEKQIKDIEIQKQQTEINAKRIQQYGLYGGLFLVILFAIIIFNRLQLTRKQKIIIEKQKEIVEEKQKEILDSIRYARKIQDATLTPVSYIERSIHRLKNN